MESRQKNTTSDERYSILSALLIGKQRVQSRRTISLKQRANRRRSCFCTYSVESVDEVFFSKPLSTGARREHGRMLNGLPLQMKLPACDASTRLLYTGENGACKLFFFFRSQLLHANRRRAHWY